MFGFLAAFYYWFPKMTGRQLDRTLSKLHFWLFEIGFLGVFIPLFLAGIRGEPRWQAYISPNVATANLISSLFAILIVASVAVFAYNILFSWIAGKRAEVNQWGGRTLEWTLPSPVPLVNFPQPVVVMAGPYDFGSGGPRTMGRPVLAGASDDAAMAGAGTLQVHDRPEQVRLGTLLIILSDVMFVIATFLAFLYLRGLDTQGQFRPSVEAVPSVLASAVLAAAAIVAALTWSWGRGGLDSGDSTRVRSGAVLAWVITLAALVGDLVLFAGLNFAVPFHAYASGIELFVFYHGIHLLIALIVGGLVIGRLFSGRLQGRGYVLKAAGYWFWWVAAAAVLTTLATAFIK